MTPNAPTLTDVLSSVLAYSLAFILIFLQGFTSTVPFPIALTSTILVAIAGKPGGNIGETINGAIYGGLGVASGKPLSEAIIRVSAATRILCLRILIAGAFFFYVLASIPSRVGQGFVFLLILYFYAYIKVSIRRNSLSTSLTTIKIGDFDEVLCLLAAGNHRIVHGDLHVDSHGSVAPFSVLRPFLTSSLCSSPGGFSAAYLQSYLIAFAYGFALVLVVNLGIFPISAERQFRIFLVQSLERISTLAHLVSKVSLLSLSAVCASVRPSDVDSQTYTLEINDEERVVRDTLHQSIRADFGFLQSSLADVSLELNWTRWSMQDYAAITGKVRQQSGEGVGKY